MKKKILKGSIILIILVLFLVSTVSADNKTNTKDKEPTIQTLSKGGLTIKYPSDWGYSKAKSNYSIMSISKLNSIDSKGVGQININFEKKPIQGDFNTFVNNSYKSIQQNSSFNLISSGESIISDNRQTFEYIYISNDDGASREHKAVWFEKGGQAYVMLYSAPQEQFESNLYVFDYILSDIKIT